MSSFTSKRDYLVVFTGTALFASIVAYSYYEVVNNGVQKLFQSKYENTIKTLKETLIILEADSDRIAKNAAMAFKLLEATSGLPDEPDFETIKRSLYIDNLFATDPTGNFIFSTNGNTLKNGKLSGINLFQICPDYRHILELNTVVQTPIVFNDKEKDLEDSYKYTMLANHNKQRILEVAVSVKPIFDRVNSVFKSDSNIKRLTLFSSFGHVLISYPKTNSFLEEEKDFISTSQGDSSKYIRIGKNILLLTTVYPQSSVNSKATCLRDGLAPDGTYHYVLSAVISGKEMLESTYNTSLTILFTLALTGLSAFICSAYFSRRRSSELAALGAKVRHDVKNPLLDISLQVDELEILPDSVRASLRHSINRIHDIVNSLVFAKTIERQKLRSHMLISQIDLIVSENRRIFKHLSNVNIDFQRSEDAYFLFSKIEASELLRVLSNVMKNSVESIVDKGTNQNGDVTVSLKGERQAVTITVKDNGKGIPKEVLPHIYDHKFTFGKTIGSGLGLFQAKEILNRWKGDILISSTEGVGTTAQIRLPVSDWPTWFVNKITLYKAAVLVVLDDDSFIHKHWDTRIAQLNEMTESKITVVHTYNTQDFDAVISSQRLNHQHVVFVVDMDLMQDDASDGFSVIMKHNIRYSSYLVTNKWDEQNIQDRCSSALIGLIPKNFLHVIPISVKNSLREKYDAVLVDDDQEILKGLEKKALKQGRKILTFTRVVDLIREEQFVSKESDICVDSQLGSDLVGEVEAEKVSKLGFTEIYSISKKDNDSTSAGNSPSSIFWLFLKTLLKSQRTLGTRNQYPWIKGKRDKENPWKN